MVECLRAVGEQRLGVILVADRASLACSEEASLLDQLQAISNLEWVGSHPDYETLHKSATRCRRRLLKFTRDDITRAFEHFEITVRYQPNVERSGDHEWRTSEAETLVR